MQAVLSFSGFSDHLFWDVDRESLEVGKHRGWLTRRVLEKGTLADWELLLEVYGKEEVGDAVKQLPGLEKKALSYACAVLNLNRSELRCSTRTSSQATLWNY